MNNIINTLVYGRYNKNTYKKYKEQIYKGNLKSLRVLCDINLILSIILFAILFFVNSITTELIYCIGINIFLSLMGILLLEKIKRQAKIFIIISSYIYILITIAIYNMIAINYDIGTLLPLISVVYIVSTFMFIDKPFRYNLIMGIFIIWLCSLIKSNDFIAVNYFVYFGIYVIGCIISYFKFNDIIEKLKILHKAEKERDLDLLTNIHNRVSIERAVTEALEYDSNGVMFIFDLDNFKEVNDTFGHIVGDEILIKVANILKGVFRKGDLIARLGGDEFAVFIEAITDKDFAIIKAEKLIKEIKEIKIKRKNVVGCSIGIAFPTKEDNFNSLFKKTDEAMYDAKHSGKSCYRFYKGGEI